MATGQTSVTRTLTVGGRTRSYVIYFPKDYNPNPTVLTIRQAGQTRTVTLPAKKYPVVFAFHGGMSNATGQAYMSQMAASADKYGYVIVYGNGTAASGTTYTWNALTCCGYALLNRVDDMAYFDAVLRELPSYVNIDPLKVYAVGFSNGAEFVNVLGARRGDKLAAIATVAGEVGLLGLSTVRRMPTMIIHGLLDGHIPYDGGVGPDALFPVSHNSIPESVNYWVTKNNCSATPTTVTTSNYVKKSYTHVSGSPANLVIHYELPNGGHTWPGGRLPVAGGEILNLGPLVSSFPASDLILGFFQLWIRNLATT